VVQAGVGGEVVERTGRPRFRVGGTEHEHADAGGERRARAHRTRFECHDERAAVEPPRADGYRGVAEREHLGVGGRVAGQLAFVVAAGEEGAVLQAHDDGADGHVTGPRRRLGLGPGDAHEHGEIEPRSAAVHGAHCNGTGRAARLSPMANTLLAEAKDQLADAVDLRRRLHRRPEIGLELPATQDAIVGVLDDLPVTVTTGESTSSVVGVLEGARPGPTLLLRADMDALPMPEDTGLDYASTVDGAMHACGHDAHVAMLASAARILARRRDELAGRVVLMFQPGEEGHFGARYMLEEGLLSVADPAPSGAFAIHIVPTYPSGTIALRPGPMMASANVLEITVTGRGGHASMPHYAVDPIPIACEIVTAIQSLVTRRVDAFDPAIVTVARITAGTTDNVIPERAELLGTIRAVSERTRQEVIAGVTRLAEGIAAAHGAEAVVNVRDGYPVTVNDDGFAAFAARCATDAGTPVINMPSPVMGAEDWSYVLQQVPGAMAFLGAQPDGPGPIAPNHSNRMVIDEPSLATGIALYAGVALDFLKRS